eukprot:gene30198-51464_t
MSGTYALYDVLGLPPQAPVEEVKKAAKKLSTRLHPERRGYQARG